MLGPAAIWQTPSVSRPSASLVFVVYEMAREIERTLATVRTQRGVDLHDVEVIVVDNGSSTPFDETLLAGFPRARALRIDPAPPSPVSAINAGIEAASADLIGAFVDGARMLSPGLVAGAIRASTLAPAPVITALAFHLGHELQMQAVAHGYDQNMEDDLLDTVDWVADGTQLFSISVLAASSSRGWFGPIGECNSLFLRREHWDALGGFDPAFSRPGGGLANHDVYRRACELDHAELFMLLGEGTFHQFHGGAATSTGRDETIWDDYAALRGSPYTPPTNLATLIGTVPPTAVAHFEASLAWLRRNAS